MKICIIPVCFNAHQDAIQLLDSIDRAYRATSGVSLDVILADNSTIVPARPILSGSYAYTLRILKNDNIGYFPAFNNALASLNCQSDAFDYVIVCNVDLVVAEDFFDELISHSSSPETGLLAPGIYSSRNGLDRNPAMMHRPSKTKIQFMRLVTSNVLYFQLYCSLSRSREVMRTISSKQISATDSFQSNAKRPRIYGAHGSFMIFTKSYFARGAHVSYDRFLFGEEGFVAEQLLMNGLIIEHTPSIRVYDREHGSTSKAGKSFICSEHKKSYDYFYENYLSKKKHRAMSNSGFVRWLFSLSPLIEMIARRIYWHNISRFSKKAKKSKINTSLIVHRGDIPLNYWALEQHFKSLGVVDGSLLVVHSSFAPLKGRVSSPDDVIDFFLRLVGPQGTLAMPATPLFKNSRPVEEYLSSEPDKNVYVYDLQRSRIQTGSLPAALHKRPGSVRSRHPINSMVALGPLAEKLMQDNLSGDSPLACGVNSSWYRCVEHNALIISLGIDLSHSLTMIHVAEDLKEGQWPVKNWYVDKQFLIKDNGFEEFRVLRERAHRWGALHFAERTLCRDLFVAGLLKSHTIDGILIEAIPANRLIDFLEVRNRTGYPYFWLPL